MKGRLKLPKSAERLFEEMAAYFLGPEPDAWELEALRKGFEKAFRMGKKGATKSSGRG